MQAMTLRMTFSVKTIIKSINKRSFENILCKKGLRMIRISRISLLKKIMIEKSKGNRNILGLPHPGRSTNVLRKIYLRHVKHLRSPTFVGSLVRDCLLVGLSTSAPRIPNQANEVICGAQVASDDHSQLHPFV